MKMRGKVKASLGLRSIDSMAPRCYKTLFEDLSVHRPHNNH